MCRGASRWDRYITALAPSMAYDIREIDPAGDNPESESAGRPPRPTEGRRDDDEARADSDSRCDRLSPAERS